MRPRGQEGLVAGGSVHRPRRVRRTALRAQHIEHIGRRNPGVEGLVRDGTTAVLKGPAQRDTRGAAHGKTRRTGDRTLRNGGREVLVGAIFREDAPDRVDSLDTDHVGARVGRSPGEADGRAGAFAVVVVLVVEFLLSPSERVNGTRLEARLQFGVAAHRHVGVGRVLVVDGGRARNRLPVGEAVARIGLRRNGVPRAGIGRRVAACRHSLAMSIRAERYLVGLRGVVDVERVRAAARVGDDDRDFLARRERHRFGIRAEEFLCRGGRRVVGGRVTDVHGGILRGLVRHDDGVGARARGREGEAHARAPAGGLLGVKVVLEVVLDRRARDRVDRARAERSAHRAVALHADDVCRVLVAVQDGALAGHDLPAVEHVVVPGDGVYPGGVGIDDSAVGLDPGKQYSRPQGVDIRRSVA